MEDKISNDNTKKTGNIPDKSQKMLGSDSFNKEINSNIVVNNSLTNLFKNSSQKGLTKKTFGSKNHHRTSSTESITEENKLDDVAKTNVFKNTHNKIDKDFLEITHDLHDVLFLSEANVKSSMNNNEKEGKSENSEILNIMAGFTRKQEIVMREINDKMSGFEIELKKINNKNNENPFTKNIKSRNFENCVEKKTLDDQSDRKKHKDLVNIRNVELFSGCMSESEKSEIESIQNGSSYVAYANSRVLIVGDKKYEELVKSMKCHKDYNMHNSCGDEKSAQVGDNLLSERIDYHIQFNEYKINDLQSAIKEIKCNSDSSEKKIENLSESLSNLNDKIDKISENLEQIKNTMESFIRQINTVTETQIEIITCLTVK